MRSGIFELTIERALSLNPDDDALWELYNQELKDRWGEAIPRDHWLTAQYLRCLRSGPAQVSALNKLATYFESQEQPLLAALCRVSSLVLQPQQPEVYATLRKAWAVSVFKPPTPKLNSENACMVSVLLCTYNRPESLRQALKSALAQTYQDFEVIVVNDGGDPAAEKVVSEFNSPKVRYFYREHGGHRLALNHGLRLARGKYIAYLDDDDIYYPHHLQTVVEAAEAEQLDFVCSQNRWVVGKWEGGQWTETADLTRLEPFSLERLHVSAVIADLTVLHTRSLVEKVGLFWEAPPRGGEWEYWVRCSHHAPIKRLETITAEVRVLDPTLPLNQPARARFFTELWRAYFGSAFGEAVLAAAAWHHGDEAACRQHVASLDGFWPYLDNRSLERLWLIGIAAGSQQGFDILPKLAMAKPNWIAVKLLRELSQDQPWQALTQLPLTLYSHLGRYLLANPGTALQFLLKKIGTRLASP